MNIDFEARKRKVREWEEGLAIRYKKAFNENKVNWYQVDFVPVTPIYIEERNEQLELVEIIGSLWHWWAGTRHTLDRNQDEKRQKIIEKEKILVEKSKPKWIVVKRKKSKKSYKTTTNKNPIKKTIYRD